MIENLFEKVMIENFPNLMTEKVKKLRKHRESQSRGIQRSPLQDIIKVAKFQGKNRILKSAKEIGSKI